MTNDFLEHLKSQAREPDQPQLEPPIDCPRCAALVLAEHLARHMDWHERTET